MRIGGESPRYEVVPVEPEAPSTGQAPSSAKAVGPSFSQVLASMGAVVDHGEALVARAAHGLGSLDSAQLIALQVGIYRYSEAVDLVAKLVDRASSAVKTVVSGQH